MCCYLSMGKLIQEAGIKSVETCEECGNKGKRRNKAYVQTLCDECFDNQT